MNFPYEERAQVEPWIGAPSQGGFTEEETAGTGEIYRYHAIHIQNTTGREGKAKLASDNDRVDGSFVSFDGGEAGSAMMIYSFRQKGMRFRNARAAPIPLGSKIIGSKRRFATPEFGYVKPFEQRTVNAQTRFWDDLTLAIINTIDGTATAAELDALVNSLAQGVGNMIEENSRARGFVRSPQGETQLPSAERSDADVIVEFGFD